MWISCKNRLLPNHGWCDTWTPSSNWKSARRNKNVSLDFSRPPRKANMSRWKNTLRNAERKVKSCGLLSSFPFESDFLSCCFNLLRTKVFAQRPFRWCKVCESCNEALQLTQWCSVIPWLVDYSNYRKEGVITEESHFTPSRIPTCRATCVCHLAEAEDEQPSAGWKIRTV